MSTKTFLFQDFRIKVKTKASTKREDRDLKNKQSFQKSLIMKFRRSSA